MNGIVRVKRTPGDFLQAYKPPFQNEKLSFAARGLLAYLCTKPDDWEVRNYDLVNASPGGKAALQTILKELRDAGHIQRIPVRTKDGRMRGCDTLVFENPADNPDFTDTPIFGTSVATDIPVFRTSEKPNVGKTERRKTGETKELIISSTNNNTTTKADAEKTKTLEQINILCREHFSDPAKDILFRDDLLEELTTHGAQAVLDAINMAFSPDRANGKSKSWGYVKAILNNPDRPKPQNGASPNECKHKSKKQSAEDNQPSINERRRQVEAEIARVRTSPS